MGGALIAQPRMRTGARRYAMMFAGGPLKVVLATVHVPLNSLWGRLNIGTVFQPIELIHEALGTGVPNVISWPATLEVTGFRLTSFAGFLALGFVYVRAEYALAVERLETYKPAGADALKPVFRDSSDPYTWTGMDAWVAAICFNTVEAGKLNIPAPTSWADLTDPVYKGHVVMPNPASSGTGLPLAARTSTVSFICSPAR